LRKFFAKKVGVDERRWVSHLTRTKQYRERTRRCGLEEDVIIDLVLDRDGSARRSIINEALEAGRSEGAGGGPLFDFLIGRIHPTNSSC